MRSKCVFWVWLLSMHLHLDFYGCLGDYIDCQCLRGTSPSSFGGRNLHRGLGDHIDPRRLGGWVGRASVGKPRSPEMPYEARHMRHQRQQASTPEPVECTQSYNQSASDCLSEINLMGVDKILCFHFWRVSSLGKASFLHDTLKQEVDSLNCSRPSAGLSSWRRWDVNCRMLCC